MANYFPKLPAVCENSETYLWRGVCEVERGTVLFEKIKAC